MAREVLITGSRGQLGTELSKILAAGKSEIGAIDKAYENCRVTAIDLDTLDITDAGAVKTFFSGYRPDIIFNCAAMTDVPGCETDSETAVRVNAEGPRNIAAAAEQCGAKLVHISTDYVFDGTSAVPYNENDECRPINAYGRSKLLGERYATRACSRVFTVRTAWLYGYTGKNFVKTVLRKALAGEPLRVVNDQFGCPTNADDLAHHLLKIALTEEYGVYHITGNGICSWYDFAAEILKDAGLNAPLAPCSTAEFPSPVRRPAYSVLDHAMLRRTVGDEMRGWKEALAAYIANCNL